MTPNIVRQIENFGHDRGMQVKMLVRVDVIEFEAGRAERLELGADLRPHLPAHMGQQKHRRAGESHVRAKEPATVHQISGAPTATAPARVDKREMQSDRKPRSRRASSTAAAVAGAPTIRLAAVRTPSACARSIAWLTSSREAEVVRREDKIFQCAVSCRSRKKRKNSTPSRRRRFMTSGLLTISPTIEAILPGRK